ncbi:MAG: hypothetical protein ACOVT5_03055 [Armatimonadaceae bacterium]|jgi:hypothetical protein
MSRCNDFLITIDREEWQKIRRFSKEWWAFRLGRIEQLQGIGRIVFRVSLETGTATPLFSLPQLIDTDLLHSSARGQADFWGKAFSRGLRTVYFDSEGHLVISDVFGVFRVNRAGEVLSHCSIPQFSDLHSALPGRAPDRFLVTSTGAEEIIEADWSGKIHEQFRLHDVFGTATYSGHDALLRKHPDRRLIPINHKPQIYHVNWAEYFDGGDRMLISCHTPGTIAMLRRAGSGWEFEWQRLYFPYCHRPAIDEARGVFYVPSSRTDEVMAVEIASGKILWKTPNIEFGKAVLLNGDDHVVAADCNGKRLLELDRTNGKVVREIALPGIPYGVCPLPQDW